MLLQMVWKFTLRQMLHCVEWWHFLIGVYFNCDSQQRIRLVHLYRQYVMLIHIVVKMESEKSLEDNEINRSSDKVHSVHVVVGQLWCLRKCDDESVLHWGKIQIEELKQSERNERKEELKSLKAKWICLCRRNIAPRWFWSLKNKQVPP